MMHIKGFSQGRNVPSSRFRLEDYATPLKKYGITLEILYPFNSSYPPESFYMKPYWLLNELIHRKKQIRNIKHNDKVIIQREFISTLPSFELSINSPFIFDVDDAIFLNKKGIAAKMIAKKAKHLICGNNFLANYFEKYNKNISIIPTGINTKIYKPIKTKNRKKIICWSGTSGNYEFLYEIEKHIKNVLDKAKDWKLRIISNKKPSFKILNENNVEFIFWSPQNEINSISEASIGIMPLPNSDWSKGKCSFKMIQYMSCGLPVVVSHVGMNTEVLNLGNIGFGIKNLFEWDEALLELINDEPLRHNLGNKGREVAIQRFDINKLSSKIINVINKTYN